MKIEVWSDFVCPFCYIGKRHLEIALEKFSHKKYVCIEYKSYELAPDAERNPKGSYYKLLAQKFNISEDEAKATTGNIAKQAAEVGLNFQFDTIQSTNTFDAHRLAMYAKKKGKGVEMTDRLLRAHFTDSEHIGDLATLVRLASEIGLDKDEVETVLESCKCRSAVREDEEQAQQLGVQGVPFFVFNEKYAVSGAQPPELFLEVLKKVWEEAGGKPTEQSAHRKGSNTTYCCGEDDRCDR